MLARSSRHDALTDPRCMPPSTRSVSSDAVRQVSKNAVLAPAYMMDMVMSVSNGGLVNGMKPGSGSGNRAY